jgi:hypothetical protein
MTTLDLVRLVRLVVQHVCHQPRLGVRLTLVTMPNSSRMLPSAIVCCNGAEAILRLDGFFSVELVHHLAHVDVCLDCL